MPVPEEKKGKLNVVLDLDQTLISAESSDEYDFRGSMQKAKKFEFHDMDGYYVVFERPGLQAFLDYLFSNFNVSIWTAASKDYALYVVDNIILGDKKNRKLDWLFFSYHCDLSKKHKKSSKNLGMLWDEFQIDGYTKDNTIIVDDYDEVFNAQEDNCILAVPFEFTDRESEKDDYLARLEQALGAMSEGRPAREVRNQLSVVGSGSSSPAVS